MSASKPAPKKPGPKPGTPRAPHPPTCPCVVCQPPRVGRSTRVVRIPTELVEWADERGGVATVLRQAKASE